MSSSEFADLVRTLPGEVGEREWVEFKHNNTNPQDIGEYLSALANAACLADQEFGYILWGVEDGTRRRLGTNFRPRESKHKNQELESWLTTLLEPQVAVSIHEGEVDGARHVLFQVGAASHRPVAFSGTRYIRVGTYKKPLAAYPEHERRLWLKLSTVPVDEQVVMSEVSGNEVLRLLDDVEMHRLQKRPHPSGTPARLDALAKCRAVIHRGEDRYDVTHTGALLLARRLSEFGSRMGRKAIRIVHYSGQSKSEPIGRPEIDAGYAVGIERAVEVLDAFFQRGERMGLPLRESQAAYPRVTVRELLANALVHQDLTADGTGPAVNVFENRVEFTNPGRPLIEVRRFLDSARTRNISLVKLARSMHLCEESGSGIDRAVEAVERAHLPPPWFSVPKEQELTRATLFAQKPFDTWPRDDRVLACYQHACLKYESGEAMTNASLRARFALASDRYAATSRVIKDAVQEGQIREQEQLSRSTRDRKYIPFWA